MGMTCDLLMAKEIGEGNDDNFGKVKLHFGTLIYEKQQKIGEKGGERSQVACEEENEGK